MQRRWPISARCTTSAQHNGRALCVPLRQLFAQGGYKTIAVGIVAKQAAILLHYNGVNGAHARGITTMGASPLHGTIEVGHHLRVGHLGDHLGHELGHLAIHRRVALARIQFGRNGQIAELGKAPADIGDVFVHAKNLADHQHHGQILLALRLGAVHRHAEAARRHGDLAGDQAVEIGLDGLRRHRQHGRGKAQHRGQQGRHRRCRAGAQRGQGQDDRARLQGRVGHPVQHGRPFLDDQPGGQAPACGVERELDSAQGFDGHGWVFARGVVLFSAGRGHAEGGVP